MVYFIICHDIAYHRQTSATLTHPEASVLLQLVPVEANGTVSTAVKNPFIYFIDDVYILLELLGCLMITSNKAS